MSQVSSQDVVVAVERTPRNVVQLRRFQCDFKWEEGNAVAAFCMLLTIPSSNLFS